MVLLLQGEFPDLAEVATFLQKAKPRASLHWELLHQLPSNATTKRASSRENTSKAGSDITPNAMPITATGLHTQAHN
jgi:hypothetical protein